MISERILTRPDSRGITNLPDIVSGGWRLKCYGISCSDVMPGRDLIDATVALAEEGLPSNAIDDGRHGVGFAIAHDGRLGRWAMYFWWSHSVWFHHTLYHSPVGAELRLRPRVGDLVACIYEMSIIEWERQVWIAQALGAGDIDGYVAARMPDQPALPGAINASTGR